MKARIDTAQEIEKFLGSIALFSEIGDASTHTLARASKFQHVDKGKMIFCQSDPRWSPLSATSRNWQQ